jgi:hypothetical protein
MSELTKFEEIEKKIISVRGQLVIIDSDVAVLYGVETKHVNQAVRNNPEKFPKGYVFELENKELNNLRSKILTANSAKSRVVPKAFTEKGLYMLATILKSTVATQTTIAIVETFAKIREFSRVVSQLSETTEESRQKSLLHKSGEIMNDILGNNLNVSDTETTIELNLAVLKLKHSVKRK